MAREISLSRDKLRNLVLYVAHESKDDHRFGLTKLNKVLYFSDFKAFGILGAPITGAEYLKFTHGPVVNDLTKEVTLMEREGMVRVETRQYFNYTQKRVVPLIDADLSAFSKDELNIVNEVLSELRDMNAAQVSALSHLEVGWQITADLAVIPYTSVYISDRRPSASEVAFAKRYAEDDEWPSGP